MIEFASSPCGEEAYELYLYKIAIAVTVNRSTKNLRFLGSQEEHDWVGREQPRLAEQANVYNFSKKVLSGAARCVVPRKDWVFWAPRVSLSSVPRASACLGRRWAPPLWGPRGGAQGDRTGQNLFEKFTRVGAVVCPVMRRRRCSSGRASQSARNLPLRTMEGATPKAGADDVCKAPLLQ